MLYIETVSRNLVQQTLSLSPNGCTIYTETASNFLVQHPPAWPEAMWVYLVKWVSGLQVGTELILLEEVNPDWSNQVRSSPWPAATCKLVTYKTILL